MLFILLVWLNATFLSFCFGKIFEFTSAKLFGLKSSGIPIPFTLLVGLLALNFLVEIWALFLPVNSVMQIIVELIAVLSFIHFSRLNIISFNVPKISLVSLLLISFFIILFLFTWVKCYYPTSHYDEGLYYIQHIRWLQQAGFVNGLANLHHRLGFHSSWLDLAAFFDYPFTAYFFNDLNGILFLFYTGYAFTGIRALLKKNYSLSNFIKVLLFFSLLFPQTDLVSISSYIFINSVSPDWASFVYVGMAFITFAEFHEKEETHRDFYSMVAILLALYSFSIKLANLSILLIPIYFLFLYINQKATGKILALCTGSVAFLLPWIIGNIILSGYLIFPIAITKLSFFDWTVPETYVRDMVHFTQMWAKTVGKVDVYDKLGAFNLYQFWFSQQTSFMKGLYLIITSTWLVLAVVFIFKAINLRYRTFFLYRTQLYILLISLIGSVFWFLTAPDFRFSAIFLLMGPFILIHMTLKPLFRGTNLGMYLFILAYLFYCLPSISLNQIYESFKINSPPKISIVELTREDMLNVPISTDQCFDCALPCTAKYELQKGKILFRDSNNFKNGFYIKK